MLLIISSPELCSYCAKLVLLCFVVALKSEVIDGTVGWLFSIEVSCFLFFFPMGAKNDTAIQFSRLSQAEI
ncbi:hypothetical protein L1987_07500 [Smallanthus sonchifolius]|uniref:Uncharacterized protein n=1 Tax=Smallanthus sonchifolius TaxID=185202 RepID=A0ACB9K0R1_9ASTR|nr:hypothetical protein L1987_07500 [Smallanthus sonchifolius]